MMALSQGLTNGPGCMKLHKMSMKAVHCACVMPDWGL
jgi:hypothetical protein